MVALKIEPFIAGYSEQTIAVAFQDLKNAQECFLRADERFHPASTFKVAVMMEAFHQAEQGHFSLDAPVPIVNSFSSIADGSPFSTYAEDDAERSLYQKIGHTETLRELVRLMIVRSSNLATNILIQRLGAARVTEFLDELGVQGVAVLRGPEDNKAYALDLNNTATARGLSQMMMAIARRKVVSQGASNEMIQILLGQEFNEGIPAGLPQSVKVAHKTGWNERLYHDFGMCFPPDRQPYVLAIMTSGFESEIDAHSCVAEISHLIYEELSL